MGIFLFLFSSPLFFLPSSLPFSFFFLPSFFKHCDCLASHPHSYHWKIPEPTSHSRNIKLEPFSHSLVGRAQTCEISLTLRPDFGSRAGDKQEASPVCWSLRTFSWYSPASSSLPSLPPAGSMAVRVFSVRVWLLPGSQDWFYSRAYDEPGCLMTLQAAVISY